MKSSLCIILSKLHLFNKNKKNKIYDFIEEASIETLNDIDYSKNFILIFDEDENFIIQNMLIDALKKSNKKVIYNKKVYDNPTKFILKSSSILSFTINADVFMLSVNRNSLKYIDMKKVDYFLINDINRNYSYKNIDEEDAIKQIIKSLSNKTKLILNLDNPYTNTIKYYHHGKTIGYGLKNRTLIKHNEVKCPICHENLIYKSRYFLNYGNYICPNKDFETGIRSFEGITYDNELEINHNKFKLNTKYFYDIYYLISFYAICSSLNIKKNITNEIINNYEDKTINKQILNKSLTLYEAKNGNIINYQKYINYLSTLNKPVLIGFSNIYKSSLDLSWLYEIDFKPFKKSIIYVYGEHKLDIKVRLELDNINTILIDSIDNIEENDINVLMSLDEFNKLGDNL